VFSAFHLLLKVLLYPTLRPSVSELLILEDDELDGFGCGFKKVSCEIEDDMEDEDEVEDDIDDGCSCDDEGVLDKSNRTISWLLRRILSNLAIS
tara:strand:+ start:829 stop:1110 length:282 start_codon:yes stop_codon:yes gene_type:complete